MPKKNPIRNQRDWKLFLGVSWEGFEKCVISWNACIYGKPVDIRDHSVITCLIDAVRLSGFDLEKWRLMDILDLAHIRFNIQFRKYESESFDTI